MRDPAPHDETLTTRGVSLRREARALLEGVDIAFRRHCVTMIMGPNGAGKSLLLRILDGLITPDAGAVMFGGAVLTIAHRKRMALVAQKPVLLRRSVAANLDFALKARGLSLKDRDALLARVDLVSKARQPARALSGGEQQRLALARALALRPDILLLDEPTASLDPASTLAIERIVAQERDAGATIVFVTHDIGQARRLADDVAFMHRGRLLEHSPAADFFEKPRSEAACAYLSGRIVL